MSKPKTYGRRMVEVPQDEWPFFPAWESIPVKVWRSAEYLAVLYEQRADGQTRLTINSTRRTRCAKRKSGTDWRDGITWDELQRIKQECLGDVWCVEVYPPQGDVVDVANMRHLYVLDAPPATRFPQERTMSDGECVNALFDALIKRAESRSRDDALSAQPIRA